MPERRALDRELKYDFPYHETPFEVPLDIKEVSRSSDYLTYFFHLPMNRYLGHAITNLVRFDSTAKFTRPLR